jgi:apolipoprotein N-acyltransferase
MSLLAAATANTTPLEKLKQVPPEFWLKLGLAILAVVVVVIALRKLAQVNKVVLGVVVFVGLTIVGFNWIYERNEPAWATPVVEVLAEFFPSKGVPAKPPRR